uniref:Signal recognition particle subunit SRP68 n=1 Tax=Zea mays TaxID=4577 RepID=B6UI77_MAIZE|nr:hypothetical protein [Zea mays]
MSKPADQQPSDMQVDSSVAEEKPAIRFSINVLELMREAQMQHGLRQSDYTRYRCVVSRAVHSILRDPSTRSARLVRLLVSFPSYRLL